MSTLIYVSVEIKTVEGCVSYSHLTLLDFSPCDRPRVIESLRGVEVVDIAAGGAHSACITASGELFTWGKGRYGRLGHGDSEDHLKPKLVSQHFDCALNVKKQQSNCVLCSHCGVKLMFVSLWFM